MIFVYIILTNLICAFLVYGVTLGTFTKKFPDQNHNEMALMLSIGGLIMGPFAFLGILLGSIIGGEKMTFAFKLKPSTKEDRWKVFKEKYPGLSRQFFEDTD